MYILYEFSELQLIHENPCSQTYVAADVSIIF